MFEFILLLFIITNRLFLHHTGLVADFRHSFGRSYETAVEIIKSADDSALGLLVLVVEGG